MRGSMRLSVKAIVILILALVFLLLGIALVRNPFGEASLKLEEQIRAGAPGPDVAISRPDDFLTFSIGEQVEFEVFIVSAVSDIEGYFWDYGEGRVLREDATTDHQFWEPGEYTVTVKVLNELGGIGEDSVVVRIVTGNSKSGSHYSSSGGVGGIPGAGSDDGEPFITGDPVFMIKVDDPAVEESYTIGNYWEIVPILPLSRWVDGDGDHIYDFVVISKQDDLVENDVTSKLNDLGRNRAVVFTDADKSINGDAITNIKVNEIDKYFNFWSSYDDVVLVDRNEEESALIAGLFASYLNAPIALIRCGNFAEYAEYIRGKKIYVVDSLETDVNRCLFEGGGSFCGADCSSALASDRRDFTSEELRNPQNINRIVELHSRPSR